MAGLDVLFFARFKVHCEVMHVRIFSSFKLILSRHTKELRGAPKTRGPRPRPIWPMRKFVTGLGIEFRTVDSNWLGRTCDLTLTRNFFWSIEPTSGET